VLLEKVSDPRLIAGPWGAALPCRGLSTARRLPWRNLPLDELLPPQVLSGEVGELAEIEPTDQVFDLQLAERFRPPPREVD
jgi:hypothetical protein